MTDWRDTAKAVLDELDKARRMGPIIPASALDSFTMAVVRWVGLERDPGPLVAWLRSDRPITSHDREALAQAIEGSRLEPRKKRRGRKPNHDIHGTAVAARHIYRRWRRLNDERGIADYGHRSEMMDEAILMAIEFEQRDGVDPEAVRELMERPASRRK